MDATVTVLKALAEPTRMRILHCLMQGASLGYPEICVCELGDVLRLPLSTLSSHLKALREARIVEVRKWSTWVYYRLSPTAPEWMSLVIHSFSSPPEDGVRLEERLKLRQDGLCCRRAGALP